MAWGGVQGTFGEVQLSELHEPTQTVKPQGSLTFKRWVYNKKRFGDFGASHQQEAKLYCHDAPRLALDSEIKVHRQAAAPLPDSRKWEKCVSGTEQ